MGVSQQHDSICTSAKQGKTEAAIQSTSHILHVRPNGFRFNPSAAKDNTFMNDIKTDINELEKLALQESEEFIETLRTKGVDVCVVDGHRTNPDALFPNNWFSTHEDSATGEKTLVLYPMCPQSRRSERRPDIIESIIAKMGEPVTILDYSGYEKSDQFLEGTGGLVLDRVEHIAYVNLSQRTNQRLAEIWARHMGYTLIKFRAETSSGNSIYHTNVALSVGTKFAIVCLESISDMNERALVRDTLIRSGKTIIEITLEQLNAFAGNALELCVKDPDTEATRLILSLSERAYNSYTDKQILMLLQCVDEIVPINVSNIETVAGGSIRCMIGEIFK